MIALNLRAEKTLEIYINIQIKIIYLPIFFPNECNIVIRGQQMEASSSLKPKFCLSDILSMKEIFATIVSKQLIISDLHSGGESLPSASVSILYTSKQLK
jgi:hypothetical protein